MPSKRKGGARVRPSQDTPDLSKRQWLHVPVTYEPKRKLKILNATDKQIDTAVAQAEFIARVLEHEDATEETINLARSVIMGSCLYVATILETHRPDPQMARDIYPYAAALMSKRVNKVFQLFIESVAANQPEIYSDLLEEKEATSETATRTPPQPHH